MSEPYVGNLKRSYVFEQIVGAVLGFGLVRTRASRSVVHNMLSKGRYQDSSERDCGANIEEEFADCSRIHDAYSKKRK
jgi:hypothetical protein